MLQTQTTSPPLETPFAYRAQSAAGETFSGTIDAPDIATAAAKLTSLQVRYTALAPVQKPARPRSFGATDFLAFNRQLAQLTSAGLPIERTLRLMASEMRAPQARAVEQIASELEKGTPLSAAFGAQKGIFPPLYGKLLDAGVRSNNLPAMLLNLGRHLETIQRLRAALWRAAAYPLMVMISLASVLSFIWFFVTPQMKELTSESAHFAASFHLVPQASDWMAPLAANLSGAMLVCVLGLLLLVFGTLVLCRIYSVRLALQPVLYAVPLIGPVLHWSLLARWCDALYLSLDAGMDLPAALLLAGDATDSSSLRAASQQLSQAVSTGRSMENESLPKIMSPLIPAALQLGAEQNDLPTAAANLATMYREQAEARLGLLPQVLAPILLFLTATSVGLALVAILLPLFQWIRLIAPQSSH